MKEKIKQFGKSIQLTLTKNPSEILIAFITCIYLIRNYSADLEIAFIAPLFFSAAYFLGKRIDRMPWRSIYYAMPVFMIVIVWFLYEDMEDWIFTPSYFIALWISIVAFFVVNLRKDNRRFAIDATNYFTNAVIAKFFSTIAYLLTIGIYTSVQIYIFNMDTSITFTIYYYAAIVLYSLGSPLMFLAFCRITDDRTDFRLSRFMNTLINYILTPALLIYTVILYLYFIRITIQWTLPEGGIAFMVFIFALIAFFAKGCRLLQDKPILDRFYDNFSFICLPALAMFWIGAVHRVAEYGWTQARVYLILCGALMTITVLLFMSRRTGRFLYATLTGIMLFSLFTFIPGISAEDIERRSQTQEKQEARRQKREAKGSSGTEADTISSDESEYISLYSDFDSIDISNYSMLHGMQSHNTNHIHFTDTDSSLTIHTPGPDSDVLFSIQFKDMLTDMLTNAGIGADTVSLKYLGKNPEVFKRYDTGKYSVIFSGVRLTRNEETGEIYINYVIPSYYLEK